MTICYVRHNDILTQIGGDIMKEIDAFETKVWGLLEVAIKKKDSSKIGQLNSLAQDIERIKKDIERIEHNIASI